jgi:hypothetical protein
MNMGKIEKAVAEKCYAAGFFDGYSGTPRCNPYDDDAEAEAYDAGYAYGDELRVEDVIGGLK